MKINALYNHIPNAITCCNLISGCIAIYAAFNQLPAQALLFIIVGATFDFFDGFAARLLGTTSAIGKELDSLADVITFGVAPASLLFMMLQQLGNNSSYLNTLSALPYAAFLIAAFSALRLAKFNLDTRQATSFIGLPTPANALFWGSLIMGINQYEALQQNHPTTLFVALLVLIALSCYIMVAEIPMFSLKIKGISWEANKIKYIFLTPCIPMLITLGYSSFAAIIIWYVILSALTRPRQQ